MVFLTIFIATCIFLALFKRYAIQLKLVDCPNHRSTHQAITPTAAGIVFVTSVLLSSLVFDKQFVTDYIYVYLAILLVFAGGIWDDYRNISPKIKFIFIFFATLLLYFNHIAIYTLGTYFGYTLTLPTVLILPFTFFAISGYTNALNLIDGLDGLAASISFIILTTYMYIGFAHDNELLLYLSSFFIITLLAFLLFNWHPASIFMGDSGSLVLGFVISVLSIEALKYITPASVLFITALPLIDTFIVVIRRKQRNLPIFKADKTHIHHILYSIKKDVPYSVFLLVTLQLIFSLIGYQLSQENNLITLLLFILVLYLSLHLFDQRRERRKIK